MNLNKKIDAEFSEWVRWDNRKEIKAPKLKGVYVIANSKRAPAKEDFLSKKVIYIGEGNLTDRIRAFHTSFFTGKPGHSGGNSGWAKLDDWDEKNYWISYCVINDQKERAKASVKLIERILVHDYLLKHKELPVCNSE